MKLTLTGLSLFVLYGLTTGYRVHIYMSTPMSATAAYSYCLQYYRDLSSIGSKEENQRLVEAAGGQLSEAWIGLNRAKNSDIWTWTDGLLYNFTKLKIHNNNDNCVYATKLQWFNGFCPDERPFFCYYNYNSRLVTMNMTWEDALMYCRDEFTDLISATEQYQLELIQDAIKGSTTDSAWTGLRFLEGEWHWVSKNFSHIPYQGSLLSCPEEPYRCGAYTKTTGQWETRDCDEMLNFICY